MYGYWIGLVAGLTTAVTVAIAGPIGFVGLIVPHAVRPFTGPDPRVLLPCAACVGGAFLVLTMSYVAQVVLLPVRMLEKKHHDDGKRRQNGSFHW